MTIQGKILRFLKSKKPGWVCTPSDFANLGSPQSIGMSLLRLSRQRLVHRLGRGFYDLPRKDPLLGELMPTAEAVIAAVRRRDRIRIEPHEAMAANLLQWTRCPVFIEQWRRSGLFDVDLVRQVMDANRSFIEYYEDQERTTPERNESFEGPSGKELEVVARASLDDLSPDALLAYMTHHGQEVAVQSKELWKILERGGYAGRTAAGKLVPTVAGIALFATALAEILPQCRVSIEAKKDGQTVSGDFEGPLIFFRDHLDKFFRDQMRHFTEIREYDRVKVGEYPTEALREAAFNAVVHRDYQAGARVHITLKETEVEVRSPDGLLKPLSLSRMRAFNAPPYSRNPHIALAFHRMGWIDEKGSGLGRMRDTMMAHGLRPPIFDCKEGYFVVRLPGRDQAWSSVRVQHVLFEKLEPIQQKIVRFLLAEKRINTKVCATQFGVEETTARRHLRKLMTLGIAEKRESGPRLHYVLTGS